MQILQVISWTTYIVPLLVLAGGAVLAIVYRRAHPTAARLAVTGLLCVLVSDVVGTIVTIAFLTATRPPLPGDDHTRQSAIELVRTTSQFVLYLAEIAGWVLVFIALFAAGRRLMSTPGAQGQEGVR